MAQDSKFLILDVRTQEEFDAGHVLGAQHIDWYRPDFREAIAGFDKAVSYKLYCRSGNRSGQAMNLMRSMGFKDVENLGSLDEASQKLKIACTKA